MDMKDFTQNPRFLRFGATLRAIEQCATVTRVYRDVPVCPFCDQLMGFLKYKATDGKKVHPHCIGRYEATITFLKATMEDIPMRYYLNGATHQYVLKCDGCPVEKHMQCNQADIRKIAEADHWEQIGNRFLCSVCALSTRRKLYRAVSWSR